MAPQAGSEREYPPFKTPLFAKIMARSTAVLTGDNSRDRSRDRDNSSTTAARVAPMDSLLGVKRPLSALYKHEYAHSSEDEEHRDAAVGAANSQRDEMEDRFLQLPMRPQPQPERKVQLPPVVGQIVLALCVHVDYTSSSTDSRLLLTPNSPLLCFIQHEVRFLREESQRLETELQRICKKWHAALPDPRARYAACEAAKQKTITAQVESVNAQLKAQLLQQQLYYALLQRTLSGAPLWQMGCVCDEMLERMHGFLHLGTGVEDRIEQLQSRFDLAIRMAPSVVESFTRNIPMDQASSQLVPFSRTSARGNETHTLISNIFMCKIPVQSSVAGSGLQRVFEAAVASQKDMQSEMTKRLGVHTDTEIVHELGEQRSYVRVTRRDGELRGLTSNIAFAAELVSDDLAVIATDFTDEDELLRDDCEYKIDSCNMLICLGIARSSTFTHHYDEAQDQHYVLLRRLHVFRYNLLSNSALLFREINRAMPYINGDLSLALLCEAMQAGGSSSTTTAA